MINVYTIYSIERYASKYSKYPEIIVGYSIECIKNFMSQDIHVDGLDVAVTAICELNAII